MALPVYITGLLYPQAKTRRARHHLDQLQRYADRYRKDPYTVTKEDNNQFGVEITRISLKKLDLMLAISVGEYVHSLRSALDHLAWQLGLLSGRTHSRASAFPLHAHDTTKDRERFMRATWNIPCEAVEIIKTLQPYNRGKDMKSDPLWQLNKLDNLDKHVTVGSSHTVIQFKVLADGLRWRSLDDSQEIEVVIPLADKHIPHYELLPPELVFGKPIENPGPDFWLSEAELAAIHSYIHDDVLPRFAQFFPGCQTLESITIDKPDAT